MTTPTLNQTVSSFSRGTTICWSYTFYDMFNNVEQPVGTPQIRVSYPLAAGGTGIVIVAMIPPGGTLPGGAVNTNANAWVALWDSRGAGAGTVSWSIEAVAGGSPPLTVLDGQFALTANAANLPTF